ncbi:gliding motility-associated C-terminal domain-containing protein [Mucilaginibacter sp. HMF5004]|uniref:gliding motility-associated C-terminal domain-containing protein n=1 Tax=Mucilaginibacter rivuli TaxID=2857527 RepID=UPI001C5FCABE|nr:gliding motility-associated C-terminal domain-containing protein [Mucilaginibacter rivuli]MBW4890801.1 gliding motility-associated C-terminal domain-containing protein [Mucilaginibacter rivuli]
MKFFYLLFILTVISIGAYCQSFYVFTNTGTVKKVTLNSGGVTLVDINMCSLNNGAAIALYKNTYYSNNGSIVQGDLSGNTVNNCKRLSVSAPSGNSLTADSTGVLYMDNNTSLYKIDPKTLALVKLGNMPFTAGGDLIFYKKDLYLASTVGIVKIDQNNTMNSSLHIPISGSVYGLAAVAYSSTQNKIYATVINKTNPGTTDLIELDMENRAIVKTVATLPFIVYDAASDVEGGTVPPIKITSITQSMECPYTGKGVVQVNCENPLVDYQYIFNNTITNTTGVFTGISPGTYNIRVKSTLATKDTTVTINAHAFDKPVVTPTKIDEYCNHKGQISFTINGNSSLYTIQSGTSNFPVNHVFTNLDAGNYFFSLLNLSGCPIDTFTLKLNKITCTIDIDSITVHKTCADLHNGNIQVYVIKQPAVSYTYLFNNSISNTTGVFNNIAPGNYPINIKTSDGVSKDTSVIVPDYFLTKPIVGISKTDENCDQKGSISFSTSLGASLYNIQYNSTTYPFNNVFNGLTAGEYRFKLQNRNGCLIDTFYVALQRAKCNIVIDSISIHKTCADLHKGDIQVYPVQHTTVTYTYLFNNSISNTTGLFNNITPGTYPINIKNSDGLSKDTSVTIPDFYLQKPAVTYNTVDQICHLSGKITVFAQKSNEQYSVKLGTATHPSGYVFNLVAGSYLFSVLNSNGCLVDTLTISIKFEQCQPVIFPNTFTPNNDGINDIFKPIQNGRATQYKLSIFNRYGGLMFTSADMNIGWDGTYKNSSVPVGAYYWLATYYNNDENKYSSQSGSVLLAR